MSLTCTALYLMNASHNVVKNNATFKAYYYAKRTEGRTHYNSLGHCARKLVRVIWKMFPDMRYVGFIYIKKQPAVSWYKTLVELAICIYIL